MRKDIHMHAFVRFNRGILKMPVQWRLWLMLLITANLVMPLFFLGHLEAQVVVGAFLASAILMMIMLARNAPTTT